MIAALRQPDLSDVRTPAESIDRPSLADDPQWFDSLTALDRGLVDGEPRPERVIEHPRTDRIDRPSLADDPQWFDSLADLDRGLVDREPRPELTMPTPLAARLVPPMALRSEAPVVWNHAGESIRPAAINSWVVSAALVLLVFTGAAGATLAFHERLSHLVARWEARLN